MVDRFEFVGAGRGALHHVREVNVLACEKHGPETLLCFAYFALESRASYPSSRSYFNNSTTSSMSLLDVATSDSTTSSMSLLDFATSNSTTSSMSHLDVATSDSTTSSTSLLDVATSDDSAEISVEQHIAALPQELQDMVFDAYISSVPSGQSVRIRHNSRPPPQLQITSATRQKNALRYYSTNRFILKSPRGRFHFSPCRFLRNLPRSHSSMIEFLIVHGELSMWPGYNWPLQLLENSLYMLHSMALVEGIPLKEDCLKAGRWGAMKDGKCQIEWKSRSEIGEMIKAGVR